MGNELIGTNPASSVRFPMLPQESENSKKESSRSKRMSDLNEVDEDT